MQTKVEDIFKRCLNGSEYIVKKIANKMAVFESKNGKSQILTGIDNLGIKAFYQKEEEAKSRNRIFIRPSSPLLGLFPLLSIEVKCYLGF
jgi:hypothetical protein